MIGETFRDAVHPVDGVRPGDDLPPKQIAGPNDLVARALAILDQNPLRTDAHPSWLANIAAHRLVDPQPAREDDLQLQRRVLSDGTECFLPIRYFEVRCLVATFLASPDRAAELLEGLSLKAVLQEEGKAIIDLFCVEYRKTDIGPYNEVGLTLRARAPGDPIAGNYVMHLPVTTAVASRMGREIWGYNKFVAGIDVSSRGKAFSTVLRDSDNELIGGLEGARSASVPAQATDILTFSVRDGRLIKTVINVPTPSLASSGDSFVFKVGTSKHPMTSTLRTLALDGARPILINYSDPFQALLFPGRTL